MTYQNPNTNMEKLDLMLNSLLVDEDSKKKLRDLLDSIVMQRQSQFAIESSQIIPLLPPTIPTASITNPTLPTTPLNPIITIPTTPAIPTTQRNGTERIQVRFQLEHAKSTKEKIDVLIKVCQVYEADPTRYANAERLFYQRSASPTFMCLSKHFNFNVDEFLNVWDNVSRGTVYMHTKFEADCCSGKGQVCEPRVKKCRAKKRN